MSVTKTSPEASTEGKEGQSGAVAAANSHNELSTALSHSQMLTYFVFYQQYGAGAVSLSVTNESEACDQEATCLIAPDYLLINSAWI